MSRVLKRAQTPVVVAGLMTVADPSLSTESVVGRTSATLLVHRHTVVGGEVTPGDRVGTVVLTLHPGGKTYIRASITITTPRQFIHGVGYKRPQKVDRFICTIKPLELPHPLNPHRSFTSITEAVECIADLLPMAQAMYGG